MTDGNAVRSPSNSQILLVGEEDRLAPARSTLSEELDGVTLLTQPGPGSATSFHQDASREPGDGLDCVVLDAAAVDDDPSALVRALADAYESTPLYVVLDERGGFDAEAALDAGATDVVRYALTRRSVFAHRLRDAIGRAARSPTDATSAGRGQGEVEATSDERAGEVEATSDERAGEVEATSDERAGEDDASPHRERPGPGATPAPRTGSADPLVENADRIRAVENELVQADSREAVEQALCERVTELPGLEFAWFGAADSHYSSIAPRAWSGDGEYLGRVSVDPTDDAGPTAPPAVRTLVSGTTTEVPTLVPGTTDVDVGGEWRDIAVECGYRAALSLPVAFDGVHHGILTVYGDSPGVFQDGQGTVVRELATTAAYALDTFEEREALTATSTLVVEFLAETPRTFLPLLATTTDVEVEVDQLYKCEDRTRAFLSTPSGHATAIERFATQDPSVVASQTLPADDERVAVVTRDPILETIASEGGRLRTFDEREDGVHFTVELSTEVDVDRVRSLVDSGGDDVSVLARRHVDDRRGHDAGFADGLERRLAAEDYEALRTAHAAGFFDEARPTGTAAVGDLLDETAQETERRLRRAESLVFDVLFDR